MGAGTGPSRRVVPPLMTWPAPGVTARIAPESNGPTFQGAGRHGSPEERDPIGAERRHLPGHQRHAFLERLSDE